MGDEEIVELLSADADDQLELYDHPDELTDEEAEQGLALYLKINDLDDEDNGLDKGGA